MMTTCLKDLLRHDPFCPQLLLKDKSFPFPRILITQNRCSCEKRGKRGPPETVLLCAVGGTRRSGKSYRRRLFELKNTLPSIH